MYFCLHCGAAPNEVGMCTAQEAVECGGTFQATVTNAIVQNAVTQHDVPQDTAIAMAGFDSSASPSKIMISDYLNVASNQ